MVIGFSQKYSFTEGIDGNVNLTLEVVSGSLGRVVVIQLHNQTMDSERSKLYGWYDNLNLISYYLYL